jgi:hypothetical protein
MLRRMLVAAITLTVASGCLRIPAAEDTGFSAVNGSEPQPATDTAGLLLLSGEEATHPGQQLSGGEIRPVLHQAHTLPTRERASAPEPIPAGQRTVHTSDVYTDANLPLWR